MSVKTKTTSDLWRTMNETDIDPLMEDGLQSSPQFFNWWVHQFYPEINDPQLHCVRANHWRPPETGQKRETDLHVEVEDSQSKRYALLVESKVNAPASEGQPEDYSEYAIWGKEYGKWDDACTVIMAPLGYLSSNRSAQKYNRKIAYEEIEKETRRRGLTCLADYLQAGVVRYNYKCSARNPDDTVGAFRVDYIDLLRDQDRDLYCLLHGKEKTQFSVTQTWFYFKLPNKDQIIHKLSNKIKERNRDDPQYLSLHTYKDQLKIQQNKLPDLGFSGEQGWRECKAYFIKDIRLSEDLNMFFDSFDQDRAFQIWRLTEKLRETWQDIVATGIYHK